MVEEAHAGPARGELAGGVDQMEVLVLRAGGGGSIAEAAVLSVKDDLNALRDKAGGLGGNTKPRLMTMPSRNSLATLKAIVCSSSRSFMFNSPPGFALLTPAPLKLFFHPDPLLAA
jgi:hypothetical protein